jgi:hypothetical protein
LQVDLTAKYGWRWLHHKMTGGGRIWRRCFKIASETVKYSPKCRDIRRINVVIRRTFVYRPRTVRTCTMFTTFTKVADFLMSSQFQAPLAPVIDSGGYSPKNFGGSNASAPNTNSLLSGLPSRPSYFSSSSFHPSPPLPRFISFFTTPYSYRCRLS